MAHNYSADVNTNYSLNELRIVRNIKNLTQTSFKFLQTLDGESNLTIEQDTTTNLFYCNFIAFVNNDENKN